MSTINVYKKLCCSHSLMKLQLNYLQKDISAHLLKCWHAINSSYKVLHM